MQIGQNNDHKMKLTANIHWKVEDKDNSFFYNSPYLVLSFFKDNHF